MNSRFLRGCHVFIFLFTRCVYSFLFTLITVAFTHSLISCGPGSDATQNARFVTIPPDANQNFSGFIIVANNTTRNVVLLDPNGNYVRDLLVLDRAGSEVPWGLGMYDSQNVMITVEGVDRVMIANLATGQNASFITNVNLTGTMRGITRLSGGDILVSDTNGVERFTGDLAPTRITSGGWPKVLLNTGRTLAKYTGSNEFLHCGAGTSDRVDIFSNSGISLANASATSPLPSLGAAHDGSACAVGPSGQVAVAWNGASDAIRVYSNSSLSTISYTYQNATTLTNPTAVAFRPNGNLLTADSTSNLMFELDPTGTLVQTFQTSQIVVPNQILVVP